MLAQKLSNPRRGKVWPFKKREKFPESDTDVTPWRFLVGTLEGAPFVGRIRTVESGLIDRNHYPYEVRLTANLKYPNAQQMHDADEGSELQAIEAKLTESLESDNAAVCVLILCSKGKKEWLFYAATADV